MDEFIDWLAFSTCDWLAFSTCNAQGKKDGGRIVLRVDQVLGLAATEKPDVTAVWSNGDDAWYVKLPLEKIVERLGRAVLDLDKPAGEPGCTGGGGSPTMQTVEGPEQPKEIDE
jgi:hypothetical protein